MVKLLVGLFAVTAIAVSSGFAAAHTQNQPPDLTGYTKEQCKNDGWKKFGIFKNQGDCVSYFATGGTNPPAGNTTTEETNMETTVNVTGGASIGTLILATINAPSEININLPAVAN